MIVYRSEKGSKVTSAEVDGNFQFLDDNKQNTLTFDNTPIEGSSNPITSGGVYDAINDLNYTGSFSNGISEYFTLKTIKIHLSSNDILRLNSVPVELIPAPGVNKIIIPTHIYSLQNFGTTPYSGTGTNFQITGATNSIQSINSNFFSFTVSRFVSLGVSAQNFSGTSTYMYVSNSPLMIFTNVDPTGGDGTIDLFINYRILDIS